MPRVPVNAVYYPSWKVYSDKPPSSLQAGVITHVFYAFVGVNEDGTLKHLDAWADFSKEVDGETGCLAALTKFKRANPHIKTIVSFGGGNSSAEFPALAASTRARFAMAKQARAFCERHHLDGIDIDWEHPKNAEQGRNFVQLLRALREALPAGRFIITAALPIGEHCLKHIDLAAAAHLLDYVNLMAYDFTGSWTDVSGHHAQLMAPTAADPSGVHPALRKHTARGVEYVLSRNFPARKLVLGVPVYARYFGDATAAGHPFSVTGEMDFCDLPDEFIAGAEVDEELATASYTDLQGDKGFVSFDVPLTVRIKARYVKAKGIGGLFYWTGTGDREGEQSLVAAGYRTLRPE